MSTNDSLKYTLNNENLFADAEPYFYGAGAPKGGYFLPIGEDNDAQTEDVKVQAAESNGYSNLKYLPGLRIQNKSIQYIEKGTFPLPRVLGEHSSPYTDKHESSNALYYCILEIIYERNSSEIYKIKFHKCYTSIYGVSSRKKAADVIHRNRTGYDLGGTLEITKTNDNFKLHGHEGQFPKRLGFILTGGGGGAGGISRIDPKSDGKNNDYTTPGGGGGGAETICGVFDLTKPTKVGTIKWVNNNDESSYSEATKADDAKYEGTTYIIYLGNGGKGGGHGQGDPDYDHPALGNNGTEGYDSIIWWVDPDVESDGEGAGLVELYKACGGFGGGAGGKGYAGAGGKGGSYKGTYTIGSPTHGCTLCKQIAGGAGGSPTGEGYATQNEALEMCLYFSNEVPPIAEANENLFYISKKHAAISNTHNTSDLSMNSGVAGGHSFGSGASTSADPESGGGGCCKNSGGRDGRGGCFGLYY